MKKIFAFCAAAAMFAACAKEVAQTPVDEFKTPVDGNALVPVELTSNVTASVVTKGQGALDAWDGTQPLYIYGYQRAQSIDYSDQTTPLIANLKTMAPGSGVGPDSIEILDGNGKPYYYISNNTYDFYGYYIDDLNSRPEYRNDGVYVPITLSGSEDVMVAKADVAADVQRAKDKGIFMGDQNWNDQYAYSAYAARRGVTPCLNFQHQLVRFTFEIVSGSDFEDNGDPDKILRVTGLSLESRYMAELCVAGNNLGIKNVDSDTKELALVERPADKILPYVVPDKDVVITNDSNVLGGSIMVIPNERQGESDFYKMRLMMTQAGKELPYDVNLKFSSVEGPAGQTKFTAGYSYRISITVYSLKEVEISAKLEPWKEGGKISIDTDDAPELI